ncbi:MAG TPA: di-heme oxidoredictase family protein [Pyrinomonadaceae bacterium]|nr:di-heme oxidoredictase family protein [Pyrinomonadaceae bacterium]
MRRVLQVLALLLFAAALVVPLSMPNSAESQSITEALTTDMDAKTDDLFNNFGARGTPIDECVNEPVAPTARGNGRFEDNKFIFSERETVEDGLGPTYNDVGCVECHQSVDPGAFSQAMEFRAGHITNGQFVDAPGGQLVHARGTDSDIVEHISTAETVKTFRVTTSALGDGFVECIANGTLQNNVNAQPLGQRGTLTQVPVVEAGGTLRFGRFGWKAQHASLQSFAGDAYLNEMGITNPFDGSNGLTENPCSTAEGVRNCTGPPFDPVPDPEDDGDDVLAFADFMAATRAPGRQNPLPAAAVRGDSLFNAVGCAVCHTRNFTTAAPGTVINGGAFIVPAALGNKIIHPFSDFALHNIGTGDGIVQNAGQGSANMMRTAPLWGIRARNRLMHQGLNITIFDSIQLHAGQATASRNNFNSLTAGQRNDLIAFVLSL